MTKAVGKDGQDVFNIISDRLMHVLSPVQSLMPHVDNLPAKTEFESFVAKLSEAAKAYEDYLSADWRYTVLAQTETTTKQ